MSKHVLRTGSDPPPMALRQLLDTQVSWRHGQTARSLDDGARVIRTDSGDVSFDILVIATGARPKRLSGIDGHVPRARADAVELRAQLRAGGRLAVIGAGLVGCEVAASARALGMHVHLIDVQQAPMVRVLGPALAAVAVATHRRNGVEFHLGCSVKSVEPGHLRLSDSTSLQADVVLHALGVSPETAWLQESA
jgi:NADPH-dependent 2,4-dienoyl-CoA reductase/sulfur reductase-like enzyme